MAAGLGYVEFTTGDILTASAANGYLASQVVMVFADAAARTSAIASPQEGMFSYLKDTNATEYYTGSTWAALGGAGGGKLGQVVQVFKQDAFTTSTAAWTDVTGLSASITPSAASSKVLAMVKVTGSNSSLDSSIRLLRGSTEIGVSTAGSSYNGFGKMNGYNYSSFLMGVDYLDSPATTSATTYKVQVYNTGGTTYINRAPIDATFGTVSSITLFEILA